MLDSMGHYEIGIWFTTDNDNDAIECKVINNLKKTFGELSDDITISSLIINNSDLVEEGQPILTLRFSEDLTGDIIAFKTGFVKHSKSQGDKIRAGETLCKIYPYWECPYCSSKFDSKLKEYNHEQKCREIQMQKFNNYIPIFDNRFDSLTIKNEINSFYSFFKTEIKKNNYIDIRNQIDYLYMYAQDIIKLDKEPRIEEFKDISEHYKHYTKFTYHCKRWISDTYLLLNNYEKALEYYPRKEIGKISSELTNTILSIKLKLNKSISGYEILSLIDPKITNWAKSHLSELEKIIDIKLETYDNKSSNDNLIYNWSKMCNGHPYNVYTSIGYERVDFTSYFFDKNPYVIEFIHKISIDAENELREKKGIPKIGEGWISETELYNKIKEHFKLFEVVHHGKPKWLGKQHLDIYFPEYNIGIEYQGKQHLEPIEFFGGREGFEKIRELDAKKRFNCVKNDCTLIYAHESYHIDELIKEISNEIDRINKQ